LSKQYCKDNTYKVHGKCAAYVKPCR